MRSFQSNSFRGITLPKSLPTVTHIYQNHHLDSTRWNDFQPRKDDIVISTSYKSGTTWTQGIMRHLVFLNREPPPLDDLSPWLDRRRRPIQEQLEELEGQRHRRFVKTHLALDGLKFYPQVKYIVVGRDTRDVFMSLWNHYSNYTAEQYRTLNRARGRVGPPIPHSPADIHKFWKNWITRGWFPWESEGYPFWGNLHHTATWWEYRNLDNILFVHYNDLRINLTNEIRRIADFLNITLSEPQARAIARGVSLDTMRQEAQQTDAGLIKSFKGGAGTFFFKGTNGRWKEVLSPAELELYSAALSKNLTPDAAHWLEHGRLTPPPLA